MKKILLSSLMLGCICANVAAQSGTNSPYSQYGLGVLSDQSQGFNRGMNGLGIGMRQGNQVNVLNPASYSSVDSLTMIFDVGMSGQITNFKENGVKLNAQNSNFEYAVASFRLFPNIGMAAGVLPYTNIGYNYSSTTQVGTSTTTSTESFTGSGGLHQAFLGLGWSFFDNFSVGANLAYLWGSYDKSVSIVNSDAYVNTIVKNYSATVNSYKVDLGLQWAGKITKDDMLTIGATYGFGHKLGSNPQYTTTNTNSQTGVSTSNTLTVDNGLSIPSSFGAGLSLNHKNRIIIGADYSLQKWGSVDIPESNTQSGIYELKSGLLSDRTKMTIGGEWIPNPNSRKYLSRVHYRMGASYATPYVKVNSMYGLYDGPKEYSISGGFGLPITNSWNNRSTLNISAQWVRSSSDMFITENTFRINVGITFNERWFMKWKVE